MVTCVCRGAAASSSLHLQRRGSKTPKIAKMLQRLFLLILMGECSFCLGRLYQYHFVQENKTWEEARTYCRKNYTDLATVYDMEDVKTLRDLLMSEREAWIGLRKQTNANRTWHWSLPGEKFNRSKTNWKQGTKCRGQYEPNDCDFPENCVGIQKCEWLDFTCRPSEKKSFICYNGRSFERETPQVITHVPADTMEDVYQYPIFFECAGLDGERQKKTERYFTVSRKSGGGDCGSITNVHGDVYCISFNKREAQERVLQKSVHVLDFAGVPLVLTVRSTPGPSTDPPISSNATSKSLSPKLQPTSSQQTQPSSLTSGLLTRDEEYELRLDSHLLRYLNECPHAMKELDKGLSSVACSAQLYPEEDRVLVSRLAQAGAAVGNWRAEVDELFDGYLCHYEADPHKVKALLRPGTSRQAAGEVKVYSDVGTVVVVGERSQVNARLMDINESHVERRSGHVKQKSTRRLGEAKLRLLWKEIEHRLRQDFPEVKVTRGDAGQIDLEGSVEEILKAGECISQHENLVLERTVSDMSHLLLAFLRKAYSGPGELGDFLGVGGKVEIELRDTEVRFLSLFTEDLDESVKTLQAEIKEVKIDVPNCSSVPPDLLEKLKSMTFDMNQGHYRAEVASGPGSTLRLLGHTKEVDELREVVIQSLDESSNKSIVHLPFPELSQKLPELLQAYAIDYTGVTFIPRTSSSGSTVVLQGPPGKLTDIRNFLEQYLDSHLEDLVPPSLSEVNTTVASYSLRDGYQVLVCQGDITKQETDVLVNAANEDLEHTGGVAAALSKAGGPEVQKECRAIVKQWGKVPTGDVVVTTGGNLKCKRLLHAVGPVGGKSGGRERILLEMAIQSALNSAELMGSSSIAIPCISSGVFGVPVALCSDAIVTAVKKFVSQGGQSLSRIILIDTRVEVVRAMQEACDRHLHGMSSGSEVPRDPGDQMGATAGAPEHGDRVEIVQGSVETQQAYSYVQEPLQHQRLAKDVPQPDQVSNTRRIVLLGKTGYGKSHLANTIFGAQVFKTDHSPNSGTIECQAETQSVNDRSTTLIDTPGLFDTGKPEEVLKTDIVKCITECAPGPHAFLIVLKVEKFTEHELAVTKKICQYFTEEVLKYAVIVFTHGDDLPKGTTIAQFVRQNESLKDLVEKCGGRCHVVDNKRWTNKQKNNYRSNQARVEDLLNSIDEMVTQNNGGHYTNEMFQVVEKEIQVEEHRIQLKLSSGNMPREEIRKQAKVRVSEKLLIQLAGTATGALLGAFYGYQEMVRLVGAAVKKHSIRSEMVSALSGGGVPLAGKVVFAAAAGGYFGSKAAEGAKTPYEAAEMAKKAISDMRSAHST